MSKIIVIITSILSIGIFMNAPIVYSSEFVKMCLIVFLASSISLLVNNCKHTFIKFEFFFLIASFFTYFAYPVFFYQISPYFSLFNLPFNENYICKGLALSLIGICFFNLGIYDDHKLDVSQFLFVKDNSYLLRVPNTLFLVLILFFIPYLFMLYKTDEYTTAFESSLINCILVFIIYYKLFADFRNVYGKVFNVKDFCRQFVNIRYGLLLVYLILFLAIGSRTIPLRIVLCILFLFNKYIVKISKSLTLVIVMAGALTLTIIGVVRSGSTFEMGGITSILDFGSDLTINNRSLYVIMEYVSQNGFSYGKSWITLILSAIPFAQGLFIRISGIPEWELNSANLVTALEFSADDPRMFGLGTNIIGDIYLAFGTVGVIFFMYLLGRMLKSLSIKMNQNSDISTIIYMLFFMDVVYLTRSSFLTFVRPAVWCYAIYKIMNTKRSLNKISFP